MICCITLRGIDVDFLLRGFDSENLPFKLSLSISISISMQLPGKMSRSARMNDKHNASVIYNLQLF